MQVVVTNTSLPRLDQEGGHGNSKKLERPLGWGLGHPEQCSRDGRVCEVPVTNDISTT
jgi:hypothetical protein